MKRIMDGKFATLVFNQFLLWQAGSARRLVANQKSPRVPIIRSPEAGQTSRAHARGVIEQNPKIVSAPTSNTADK